jgi:hypothetical protein
VKVGPADSNVGLVVTGNSSKKKFRFPDRHTLLAGNFWKIDVHEVGEDRRVTTDLALSGYEAVFLILRLVKNIELMLTGFMLIILLSYLQH